MQRFVNDPDYIVEDMVKGYVKAHKDLIKRSEANDRVVQYVNAPVEGKVGLVTGGGSGHEPAFLGYVGKNMMDAVAVGEIFSSPSAQAFYDAFMSVDSGQGVACLFGNYAGDNMNVKMAIRKAKKQGVTVKYVVATDDVASSPKETKEKRHGIADGVIIAHAGVDDGAKRVCLSLLTMPERTDVYGYMEADVVIMIGTPDPTKHLEVLEQLNHIIEDKKSLQLLKKAKKPEDIIKLIQKREKEKKKC